MLGDDEVEEGLALRLVRDVAGHAGGAEALLLQHLHRLVHLRRQVAVRG